MADFDLVVLFKDEFESLELLTNSREFQEQNSLNILLIDNGSTDPRIEKCLMEVEQLKQVQVFRLDKNLGFGGGIKHGLRMSSAPLVGWYPLNLKVHFNDVLAFANAIGQPRAELYKAIRVRRPFLDSAKTLISGILLSAVSGRNLIDSGGTPTFIKAGNLKELDYLPDDYVFELAVLNLARRSKWRVQRWQVPYGKRRYGKSHWQHGLYSEMRLLWSQMAYLINEKND